MKPVIVFGTNDVAELAHYYFENDSDLHVVAFTVHKDYLKFHSFKGLPVVDFDEVCSKYPPSEYSMFVPMFASNMNKNRQKVYQEAKGKGYELVSYVSSYATVLTSDIGENCFILEDNTIQPFTSIGNNVVLWSGNHIGHHSVIRDHVFVSSHVVISGHCDIGENCFLGVNSTIRNGITLQKGALLGMSASLTSNTTEDWGVYSGNPAKLRKARKSYDLL